MTPLHLIRRYPLTAAWVAWIGYVELVIYLRDRLPW